MDGEENDMSGISTSAGSVQPDIYFRLVTGFSLARSRNSVLLTACCKAVTVSAPRSDSRPYQTLTVC